METGRPVIPVFILDGESAGSWAFGGCLALVAAPRPDDLPA
ncbi:MAG: hypothetical protein ABSC06_23200 [Rhodopila sp.]